MYNGHLPGCHNSACTTKEEATLGALKRIRFFDMPSKVIIVTGASRGIGYAVTKHLLEGSHNVVLVSRTKSELEALKARYPSQVEYLAGDLTDFSVRVPTATYGHAAAVNPRLFSDVSQIAPKVTDLAVKAFGRLDGIVINHGVLSPMKKIVDSNADDWRQLYDANVFSALALVNTGPP